LSGRSCIVITIIVVSITNICRPSLAFTTSTARPFSNTVSCWDVGNCPSRHVTTFCRQHQTPLPYSQNKFSHETHLLAGRRSQPSQEDKLKFFDINNNNDTSYEYVKTVVSLVTGQSSLILVAVILATILKTPNYGLGPNMDISLHSITEGIGWTFPLGILAVTLDRVEDKVPALQEVSKVSQQFVLKFLGNSFRPLLAIVASTALGLAAGVGEEWLFRGVLQYELGNDVLAVGVTSIVFGALHAVTPLYAFLASAVSIYFGWLYLATGNLALPMACHSFYDLVVVMYAHWEVTQLSKEEQEALLGLSES
jgi:membrane protease YdiL (CAAX protease family)